MAKTVTKLATGVFLCALTTSIANAQQVTPDQPDLSVATDVANLPDPRAPKAIANLAFMLGEWNLSTTFVINSKTTHTKARMEAHYAMGGFAIEQVQIHPGGDSDTKTLFVSSALFSVHPKTGEIVGVSQNTLGNRKFIDGKFVDGSFITTVSGEMFQGAHLINRFVYADITPTSFNIRTEASDDDGETWRDGGYMVHAERKS